jgi:hypothetical protein
LNIRNNIDEITHCYAKKCRYIEFFTADTSSKNSLLSQNDSPEKTHDRIVSSRKIYFVLTIDQEPDRYLAFVVNIFQKPNPGWSEALKLLGAESSWCKPRLGTPTRGKEWHRS